jgi:hypothetical protein
MTAHRRIDDCLSTQDGHLFVEECDAVELVRPNGRRVRIGTDEPEVLAAALRDAMGARTATGDD